MQSGTTGINTIQFIINKKLEDHDTEAFYQTMVA
jgi:hypothetical protein